MIELIPFFLLVFYIMPFIVAAARDHPSLMPILIANLAIGWTVIGWWGVLAWAVFAPGNGRGAKSSRATAGRSARAARPRILHPM
jgi:hypothetical protein